MATRLGARAPHEALGLSPDDLRAIHRHMRTARLLDEATLRLNRQGRAPFVVPAAGHEACQVGTAMALDPARDWCVPYYRDLGVVLVAGMTPYEVLLGVFSKADDPTAGGRQMPAHWGSRRLRILSGSSVIATQIAHAAGLAYATSLRGEDTVTASWFGDGATSSGAWHEALNFAGIHRLPIVFVCENNRYAISVHQHRQMAIEDVADRAAGYGFPGVVVDGNDVLACFGAMRTAVERARAGDGPTLIEAKTYRFHPHTSDDDDRSYRSREEVEEARAQDPVERFTAYLVEWGVLDHAAVERADAEIRAGIEADIERAWNAPDPDPATLLDHVFGDAP
ncbi:MAG: thiamine pyrophosphate-dependent dehydrogenase E1 component subunit alpha [Actinomycetota bacterium]